MNEKSIFAAALEMKTAAERLDFLNEACAKNPELRADVEELLKAHEKVGSFLCHAPAELGVVPEGNDTGPATAGFGLENASLPWLEPCDKPDRIGKLGQYEIIEVVGRGSMGTVLRAFDTKLSRVVAVKVMAPELAANPTAVKRFLREATTAAAVVHDHVVTIHAVDDAHRPPFLVMEYIDGQTLQQKIDREGALDLKTILRIGSQTAAGLAAAHKTGLIHRDVKPGNILLENGVERVKITDFGLARAADDSEMTKPGMIAGTPQYMSPEQAKGEAIDTRSDLFSLGSVLYTMCTGRAAFRAETTIGVLKRVCDDEPRPIYEVNPELPSWLDAIVGKLLAKNPQDRFQSAAEVSEMLAAHLGHLEQPSVHPQPALVGSPTTRSRSARGPVRRNRQWQVAALIALLLFSGWGLSEATGVTEVVATLIRVVRGDGTLVVEVDDPNIQVLIDGEELVITGAGPKEIRLRPGKHEVHAVEDGKPIETNLVTIARGGREVVKISRERTVPIAPSGPTVRRIEGVELDGFGSISPDGRYQSYVGFPKVWDTGDLAIRDLQTGQSRRLTSNAKQSGQFALRSVFSPDGKRLAYVWYTDQAFYDLRVIDLEGDASPRVVFRDRQVQHIKPIAWSPDGDHVLAAIARQDKSNQLALVPVADGSLKVLRPIWADYADFSPDGRYVVYGMCDDIFVQPIDGGDQTALVKHSARDNLLGWSPDGRWVLFSSDRRGSIDAWAMRVANGKPEGSAKLVKLEIGNILPVRFTRDDAFYYQTWSGNLSIVYTASIDVESGKVLTPAVDISSHRIGENSVGAWSPDGKSLAYLSRQYADKPLRNIVVIRNAESEEEREIEVPRAKTGIVHATGATWSPDGRFIAFAGRQGIFRLDVQRGEVSPIVEPGLEALWPAWSPDGKSLYYILIDRRMDQRKTLRRDLETGQEEELVRTKVYGGAGLGIAIAPDGSHLAYLDHGTGRLNLLRIADRHVDELFRFPQGQSLRGPLTWTPDGRNLLFIVRSADQETHTLWRVSRETRKADKIDLAMRYLNNVSMHPDGKRIAFSAHSAQSGTSELWAMENFLPPPEPENEKATKTSEKATPITRQVWGNAADITGGPSPDGRLLAFVDWDTGDLAVRDLTTGQNRRLTKKGTWNDSSEFALSPRFSPDGKRIAYTWFNKDNKYDLRVVPVDGGSPQVLYIDPNDSRRYPEAYGWTPDGKSILAGLDGRTDLQIALLAVTDSSVRVIKSIAGGRTRTSQLTQIRLAPDGRSIAYSRIAKPESANRDIFLMDIESGQETQVTARAADEYVLAWTPDGQRLLVAMARQGAWDAWMIRISDGKAVGDPVLIKSDIGTISPMGITSDGTLYYGLDIGGPGIFTAVLDVEKGTAKPRPLPEEQLAITDRSSHPTWSADGKYLAYKSVPANRTQRIKIVNMETGEARLLQPDLNVLASFRWAPDGQSFISSSQKEPGRRGIYRIDVRSGDVTTVVELSEPGAAVAAQPRWSPDGRGIYYVKGNGVVYRDVQTENEKEILPPGNSVFDGRLILQFDVSPDGHQLAVLGREQNSEAMITRLVAVSDGASRELVRMEKSGVMRGGVVWEPDGRSLLFLKSGGEESKRGLWRIAADGGQPQKIDVAGIKVFRDLALHPGGKQIAFNALGVGKFEVWAMENFLPAEQPSTPR